MPLPFISRFNHSTMRLLFWLLAHRATTLQVGREWSSTRNSDVVVVGGGISGLATALELRRRGRSVMVLSRDLAESATRAAGGMLAPQAERLESGPLLDLCVQARDTWPEWLASLGADAPMLNSLGGFVSPALSRDDPIFSHLPPLEAGPAEWLDASTLGAIEPALRGSGALGGYWYALDCAVDPIAAHKAALDACRREGVDVRLDVQVAGLELSGSRCGKVLLGQGESISATDVCVASGAWLRSLLPIPIEPQKGQMVSLRPPPGGGAMVSRVVYGARCYLIPRGESLVVGATVEDAATLHCDVQGVRGLLSAAVELCPGLEKWILEEAWAGLRPTAPDSLPVLGKTRWSNLWVVGGYWRNGILLAPRAATLLADAIDGRLKPADDALLSHFAPDRFLSHRAKSVPSPRTRQLAEEKTPKPSRLTQLDVPRSPEAVMAALAADDDLDILDLIDRESLSAADAAFVDDYEARRAANPISLCTLVNSETNKTTTFRYKFPPTELGVPTKGVAARLVALAASKDAAVPPAPREGRLLEDRADDSEMRAKAEAADRLYAQVNRAKRALTSTYSFGENDVVEVRWGNNEGLARIADILLREANQNRTLADVFGIPSNEIDKASLTISIAGRQFKVFEPCDILARPLVSPPSGCEPSQLEQFFPFVDFDQLSNQGYNRREVAAVMGLDDRTEDGRQSRIRKSQKLGQHRTLAADDPDTKLGEYSSKKEDTRLQIPTAEINHNSVNQGGYEDIMNQQDAHMANARRKNLEFLFGGDASQVEDIP